MPRSFHTALTLRIFGQGLLLRTAHSAGFDVRTREHVYMQALPISRIPLLPISNGQPGRIGRLDTEILEESLRFYTDQEPTLWHTPSSKEMREEVRRLGLHG